MSAQQGSSKTKILFIGSVFLLVIILCGYCFWPSSDETGQTAGTGANTTTTNDPSHHGAGKSQSGNGGADAEYVMIGGVRRKASDVRATTSKSETAEDIVKEKEFEQSLDYGRTPPVAVDANPNTKSVAEALRNKNHPERLTPMVAPTPFNAKAYAKDPQAYLDVVEPGRAFAPAQPGKDVPRLQPASDYFQKVVQGNSVKLSVIGVPKMPVTFTSLDLGQFSNQLTSISVAADNEGVAEVEFIATPGTIDDVRIIAAGPATSGQARFIVNVERPKKTNP